MIQDESDPIGIDEYCSHNCCPACCIVCLTPDSLKESNCYCGQPMCYFGRQREYNKGVQRPLMRYACVCRDDAHHVLRAVWVKPHKDRRHHVQVHPITGIVHFPPGTTVVQYFACTHCLGEHLERDTVQ